MPSLYETTPQTGTVSSANSTSLYSNTADFTTGLVNSSVYSVNGGTGVTVNPITGNVVVSIGQDVATTADVTFATANISDIAGADDAVIYPLTVSAVAGSGITPTAGYGVGILAQATLTNGSLGSLGRLNWESDSTLSGDNDSTFNVYTYENGTEYKSAIINQNGAYFQSRVQLAGETSGYVSLSAGFTPAAQAYTLPQAYPAVSGYVLASTTGGAMSWVSATSLGTVSSITGTANQVIASSPTGAVTLSLPQDIATTSNPTFAGVTAGFITAGITDNVTITTTTGNLTLDSATNQVSITSNAYVGDTLTVNTGTITTNSGNVVLFDTVATSVSSFGAATSIDMGASTGTTTINNTAVVKGGLKLDGTSSGSSTFTAPSTGSTLSYVLPSTAGAASTVLTNDGTGTLSWALPGGGGSTFGNITIAVVTDNTISTTTGDLTLTAAGGDVNVTGNLNSTGSVSGDYFAAGGVIVYDASGPFTTSTTTPNQVASTTSATGYRSLKYMYQITSGTEYQVVEIMVIHDGTTAYLNTYGDVRTGANLSTFDADISGGNIRLLVTPTNAVTTYKGSVIAIEV